MDYKFRKLKSLLSDDEVKLPQELDWDRMQEGITKKMEALEAESAVPTRRSGKTTYRIIALLGLLLIPMLCSRQIRHARILTVDQATPWGLSFGQTMDKKATNKQTRENHSRQTPEANVSAGTASITRIAATGPNPKMDIPEGITGAATSLPVETSTAKTHSDTPNLAVSEKKPDETLQGQAWTIPTLPTRMFAPTYEPKEAVWEPAYRKRSKKRYYKTLSASTGIAFWSPGYGKDKPVRHEFEKSRLSFLTNLTYTHPLKKGYFLSTGLQFIQLESRFNWNGTLNNYEKIELKDTVVQVQINTLTGEQTKVYGDVEIIVDAERTVQHYNTTRLVQIPFAFGKTFSGKKWSTDLSLGGALNILSSNKGRTMPVLGDIIDYNGSSTSIVDNQWKVHAFVTSQMNYLVTERMGIHAGIMYQRSLSNWSQRDGETMHPNILSLNMGLSYRLTDRK